MSSSSTHSPLSLNSTLATSNHILCLLSFLSLRYHLSESVGGYFSSLTFLRRHFPQTPCRIMTIKETIIYSVGCADRVCVQCCYCGAGEIFQYLQTLSKKPGKNVMIVENHTPTITRGCGNRTSPLAISGGFCSVQMMRLQLIIPSQISYFEQR